ncbi:MAG TPA: F0F1 ATP synthase subunit A [Gemmatimonadota bacterium]|nr:F0F1 ATP synthase subunit A [Gemmatimonadota bacterium]
MTNLQEHAVDTLHQAAGAAAHGAADAHGAEEGVDIVHHLADGHVMEFPPFGEIHLPQLHLFGLDLSITKYTVYMWIAAALLLLILLPMARRRGGVYHGIYNAFEALIVYVRDEIVYANIGREDGRPYVPFIATLFFFILFMNLLGLVPYGGTPTGNLAVTGVLALFSMIAIEVSGIVANGPVRYAKSLVPQGVPLFLAPIMIPIEIIGHFAKPFALMIRLFANMTAGHVVILSMLGLIFLLKAWLVVPISVGFALFIFLLELLIAFIQAYIFSVLTAVFINLSRHPH